MFLKSFKFLCVLASIGLPLHASNPSPESDPCAFHLKAFTDKYRDRTDYLQLYALEPDSIGPLKAIRVLGKGGSGRVILAEERAECELPCVTTWILKTVKLNVTEKERLKQQARFLYESQILKSLGEPVKLIRYERRLALATPVFPRVPGISEPALTLHEAFKNRASEIADAFSEDSKKRFSFHYALQTAIFEEMHRVHAKGIVHSDLKPANILIQVHEGKIKVKFIDWGVSGPEHFARRQIPSVRGTPGFMGHESFDGYLVTQERDLNAVFALFNHLYLASRTKSSPDAPNLLPLESEDLTTALRGGRHFLGRAQDHLPYVLPPEIALVIHGGVLRTPETGIALWRLAREAHESGNDVKFLDAYTKAWQAEFDLVRKLQTKPSSENAYADYIRDRRELLFYSLISAPNMGPKIFSRLADSEKKQIHLALERYREISAEPTRLHEFSPAVNWVGPHRNMRAVLELFAASTEYQKYSGKK